MSDIVKNVTLQEFHEIINEKKSIVLVDFWATWCSPCRMQAPILEELAEDMNTKIRVIKVDVDKNEELAFEYKITSIPCLILFKNGEQVDKTVGLSTKQELTEMLVKYL